MKRISTWKKYKSAQKRKARQQREAPLRKYWVNVYEDKEGQWCGQPQWSREQSEECAANLLGCGQDRLVARIVVVTREVR